MLLVKDVHSHLWGLPGGGVEDSETHDDTLWREFLEETGLYVAGESRYITEQTDVHKQRFFYAVDGAADALLKAGNDSDIEMAGTLALSTSFCLIRYLGYKKLF